MSKIKAYSFQSPREVLAMHRAIHAAPGNSFYRVTFVKKDGTKTTRLAATKAGHRTILGTGREKPGFFNFVDIGNVRELRKAGKSADDALKASWRCFNVDNLVSITCNGIEYRTGNHD